MDDSTFLTLADVCERLRLSRWAAVRLINSGDLKAIKTGPSKKAQYRISEAAYADYVRRNTVQVGS